MDFELPEELAGYLTELDAFIEAEIVPLEQQADNIRFFDHRREDARTDWDRGGLPRSGSNYWPKRVVVPMPRATTAMPSRASSAGATAPISGWP